MSKKKAPALHERRGREDISTRPPRLAGCPIKLAGDARLHRLSLAADSCVNRKYYGGDPGVGQRKTGLHTIPPSGTRCRRPGARFSLGQVLARTKSTLSALRLVRNLRKPCAWPSAARPASTMGQPGCSLTDAPRSQSLSRWADGFGSRWAIGLTRSWTGGGDLRPDLGRRRSSLGGCGLRCRSSRPGLGLRLLL